MTQLAFDTTQFLTSARVIPAARLTDYRVESPADPYLKQMNQTSDVRLRTLFARDALNEDPLCVEANFYLALRARTNETRIEYLNAAIVGGKALWSDVADEWGMDMDWMACRPLMSYWQSVAALGYTYEAMGDVEKARLYFQRAIDMHHDFDIEEKLADMNRGMGLRA